MVTGGETRASWARRSRVTAMAVMIRVRSKTETSSPKRKDRSGMGVGLGTGDGVSPRSGRRVGSAGRVVVGAGVESCGRGVLVAVAGGALVGSRVTGGRCVAG